MYLVELRPGKEELYRTSDDLALAIRDGDVDARSRIYHRATAKWISITLHPQYKAIVGGLRDEQVARASRKAWGLLPATLSGQAVEESSHEPANVSALHRWKRTMGLGLSGLLLVLGIQLAASGPRPPWAGGAESAERIETEATERTERTEREERTERVERTESVPMVETFSSDHGDQMELVSLASTTGAGPATSPPPLETVTVRAPRKKAAPTLPRAPRLRSKALRAALAPGRTKPVKVYSAEGILRGYAAASDSVRIQLETGMRVARLDQLFASSRLTPGGGVPHTRLTLAGAVTFIRVFRQQQAAVERAYQDSVTLLAKRHRWTRKEVSRWHSRAPRTEQRELELVSDSLVAAIDSVLGVLTEQAGAYKIRGTAIAFEDPAAGKEYGALRARIKEQIAAAKAAGGATSPGPTGLLLRAIGTSSLPRET
ncbi:MAG: hypothetical protein ACREMZ_08795 [Gemmatimonadales bacterium]